MFGRANRVKNFLLGRHTSGFASSLQTVVANVLILVVNVMTGIITARLLGPNDKGVQAAIILWPILLINLSNIGLHTALLYHVRKSAKLTNAFLSAALILGFIASLIASGLGVIFVPFFLSKYSAATVHFAQLFMLFVPVAVLSDIYNSMTQAKGDFQTYNGLRLLQPLITLALLIALAVTGTITAFTAAFAFLCPAIAALFWLWLRTKHLYKFSFSAFGQVYGQLLSYGARSYSGDILAVFLSQLDKIVIVGLLTPSSLGLYTVAFSLARMLVVFRTAVSSVILPKMIDRPISEISVLLGRAARVSTFVTLVAATGMMVLGPFLISFFLWQRLQRCDHRFSYFSCSHGLRGFSGATGSNLLRLR